MDLLLHPVLYFGLGPAAGILAGLLVTRRLIRRASLMQAVLAGLLLLAALFGLQQLALRAEQLAEFADSGPCINCGEWNWVPHLINWATWGVGGLAFIVISMSSAGKIPPAGSPAAGSRRRQVIRLLAGLGALVVLAWGANRLLQRQQQLDLAKLMQRTTQPIAGVPDHELGRLRLPHGGFGLGFSYADELEFSKDGRWLAIGRMGGWDVWRLSDFKRVLSLEAAADGWVSFSPDSSQLATTDQSAVVDEDTQVYRLSGDKVRLAWSAGQDSYQVYQSAFSPDGSELRILDASKGMARLDAATGQVVRWVSFTPQPLESALPGGTRRQWLISPSGAYVALAISDGCRVDLFAADTGTPLGVWNPAEGACPGSDNPDWGRVAFFPDDTLVWMLEYDQARDRILWTPPGGQQLFLDRALAEYPDATGYAIAPDWRLAVLAGEKTVSVWDLEQERPLGSLSTDAAITSVEFTADGSLLAVGTADGYLRFYSDQVGG